MPAQFMVDIEETELSAMERTILQHPNVGAVILFTRNFANAAQLKNLVGDIKRVNPELFIAVDHEGGNVQRFQRHGFSSIPAARTYSRIYDRNREIGMDHAQEYGQIMAQELLAHGIHLSLAPVLDLHGVSQVIAGLDRAFHSNPDAVVDLAGAFIAGMNRAGMPAVGKHYPGHGHVASDSHITMPSSSATLEELANSDLKPFIELINKGLLAAVMPAHITYTQIDAENPAGFSRIWLQDILRTQLGFKGLVISDCLSMKGADIGDLTTRATKALDAGCDLLIVCHQPRERLLSLLENIAIEQPVASAQRIIAFKQLMASCIQEQTLSNSAYSLYGQTSEGPADDNTHQTLNRTTTI